MKENKEIIEVCNFQIQYFPNDAKDKIDAFIRRNQLSRKKLLLLFARNLEKIEDFMKKEGIL